MTHVIELGKSGPQQTLLHTWRLLARCPSLTQSYSRYLMYDSDKRKIFTAWNSKYVEEPCSFRDNIAGHFQNHWSFDVFFPLMILVNGVSIGFSTDMLRPAVTTPVREDIFRYINYFFIVVFTLELLVRTFATSSKKALLKDGWFLFDVFLVGAMYVDFFLDLFVMKAVENAEDEEGSPLFILSILRIFRLLRLLRLVKIINRVPMLARLVSGMGRAKSTSICIFTGLFAMVYVCGLTFAMLSPDVAMFRTLPEAMFTTFCGMVLMDEVSDILFTLRDASQYFTIVLWILFTAAISFTALNIFVAMLCDIMMTATTEINQELALSQAADKIDETFNRAFRKEDDKVTYDEFMKALDGKNLRKACKHLKVEPEGVQTQIGTLFPAMDALSSVIAKDPSACQETIDKTILSGRLPKEINCSDLQVGVENLLARMLVPGDAPQSLIKLILIEVVMCQACHRLSLLTDKLVKRCVLGTCDVLGLPPSKTELLLTEFVYCHNEICRISLECERVRKETDEVRGYLIRSK